MRKLYLFLGLAFLVPVLDIAACGGGDGPGSGGASTLSGGTQGGQVQDFNYNVHVTWTIFGKAPSSSTCQGDMMAVTLSGTEDPSQHATKTADCASTDGVTFGGLTRLTSGNQPLIEGILQNPAGMLVLTASATATPTPGTVEVVLEFVDPNMATTSTTGGPGPGAGGNGGMGGMGGGGVGGAGGAGGAGTTSSGASTGSGATTSSAASTGTG